MTDDKKARSNFWPSLLFVAGFAIGAAVTYQSMKYRLAAGVLECAYIEAYGQQVAFCYNPNGGLNSEADSGNAPEK